MLTGTGCPSCSLVHASGTSGRRLPGGFARSTGGGGGGARLRARPLTLLLRRQLCTRCPLGAFHPQRRAGPAALRGLRARVRGYEASPAGAAQQQRQGPGPQARTPPPPPVERAKPPGSRRRTCRSRVQAAGRTAVPVSIRVGLSDGQRTEVLEGLAKATGSSSAAGSRRERSQQRRRGPF